MSEGGINPKSLLSVLRGALDRRVKQRSRDTIVDNAIEDPAEPLVQRVVEPDACDHCKKLGNSRPVEPRQVAGEYHQYCKCHIALVFARFVNRMGRLPFAKSLEERAVNVALSDHAKRMLRTRGVLANEVVDARWNPLHRKPIVLDEHGRPSYQLIGENATIAVNPNTDVITSLWKTGSKTRERYRRSGNRGVEPRAS